MTINHAGTLSVDYFISYLNLIMKSRDISLTEAVTYMQNEFFKGEPSMYGKITETHFNQAIQVLKQK